MAGEAFEIALGVAVQMPIRHIERRIDMRDDSGALVNLGQQHQAIDTGAFDASGMVKRRPDPRFGFPDDGFAPAIELGGLFSHVIHNETARR